MAEKSSGNVLAVSLLAGTVGVLIALMFAPRSGRETRRKIGLATDDLRDKTSDSLDNAQASLQDQLGHAKAIKNRLSVAMQKRYDNSNSNNSAESNSPILTSWDEEV